MYHYILVGSIRVSMYYIYLVSNNYLIFKGNFVTLTSGITVMCKRFLSTEKKFYLITKMLFSVGFKIIFEPEEAGRENKFSVQ